MTEWPENWKLKIPAHLAGIADVLIKSEDVLSDGYGWYCDFDDFIHVCEKIEKVTRASVAVVPTNPGPQPYHEPGTD